MTKESLDLSYAGTPSLSQIPVALRSVGVMSTTSSALECFVNQRFSEKLQAFMISYNLMTAGDKAVYSL